jgi:hypothetical protein
MIMRKLRLIKMRDNKVIGKSKIEVTGSRNSGNTLQYSYAHVPFKCSAVYSRTEREGKCSQNWAYRCMCRKKDRNQDT